MNDLTEALRAALDVFDELGLPYVVMGGLAVRFFGVPRPTYDVDFTISSSRSDLPRLYAALEQAGFTVPEAYRGGWVDCVNNLPLVKFRLFLGGEGIDIDVFLAESEFQRELMRRRVSAMLEGRSVWFVTPEDLILLKLIANRSRDHIDIADVRFMQGQLDEAYMRNWARRIGVSDRLEQVLKTPPV